MDTYSHDRRNIYDLDYFTNGGIERKKGSWERRTGKDNRSLRCRRSGKDRRLPFNPKYIFVPEKRSDQDRRRVADRRLYERRTNIDRRKIETNR